MLQGQPKTGGETLPTLRWSETSVPSLRGILAVVSAMLVFMLGLLAVSPQIHAWLHGGAEAATEAHSRDSAATSDGAGDDSGCAVHLYAQGITSGAILVAISPVDFSWSETYAEATESRLFSPPRYLLRPERGPPSVV